MEIVSKANSVRSSPKKLRKVADLVRGLNVNKALNSLSHMDEKGAAIILKTLSKNNIRLISSGGTFKKIKKLGYKCLEVSKYTGSKEILSGRVKTLHPKIHACLLYTSPSPRD